MRTSNLFNTLAICLWAAASGHAAVPKTPEPAVEERAARELWNLQQGARSKHNGSEDDCFKITLALDLARLGRLDGALQTTGQIDCLDGRATNSRPATRGEVLRLCLRRRCVLGDLAGAKSILPLLSNPNLRSDGLLAFARAERRAGDLPAARVYLGQVVPAGNSALAVFTYTAYQYALCGDTVASKRLFAKAIAGLPPLKPGSTRNDSHWEGMDHRAEVAAYLLKAGFVDDWERVRWPHTSFISASDSSSLARLRRLDVALHLTRQEAPHRRVADLVFVALLLDSAQGDRAGAIKIIEEAEAIQRPLLASQPQTEKQAAAGRNDAFFRYTNFAVLAAARRILGDEAAAAVWSKAADAVTGPGITPGSRFWMTLLPVLSGNLFDDDLTREQTSELSTKVQAFLAQQPEDGSLVDLLRGQLVPQEIKYQQWDAARASLEYMEKVVLKDLGNAKDLDGFTRAMETARFWRQCGDEDRAQKLLQRIFDFPNPRVSLLDRAHWSEVHGFLNEGRLKMASAPPPNQRGFSRIWDASCDALYRPSVFPEWIVHQDTPVKRLHSLDAFVLELTRGLFSTPEETELALSQNGSSLSY